MEWIKCSDKLPEKSGRYFVYVESLDKDKSIHTDSRRYPYPTNSVNIAYFSKHLQPWAYSDMQCESFYHKPIYWAEIENPDNNSLD
jgi:hypothetical protein